MLYAHQGLDTKPPYGVAPGPPPKRRRSPPRAAPKAGARRRRRRRIVGLSPRSRADHHRDRRTRADGQEPTRRSGRTRLLGRASHPGRRHFEDFRRGRPALSAAPHDAPRLTWVRAIALYPNRLWRDSTGFLTLDTLIKVALACLIGLVLGLWATLFSLRNTPGFETIKIGAWTAVGKGRNVRSRSLHARRDRAQRRNSPGPRRRPAIPRPHRRCRRGAGRALRLSRRPQDAAGALLDLEPRRPARLSRRKSGGALRVSLERDSARRRRQFRHRGIRERASRQLAAGRIERPLRPGAAPLRFAGQRDSGGDRQGGDAQHRQGKLPVNLAAASDRFSDDRPQRRDDRRARAYRRHPHHSALRHA